MTKARKKRDGFTLVELIAAFSVLSVIAVVFIQSFVVSANVRRKASDLDNATANAVTAIERFRMDPIGFVDGMEFRLTDDGTIVCDVLFGPDWVSEHDRGTDAFSRPRGEGEGRPIYEILRSIFEYDRYGADGPDLNYYDSILETGADGPTRGGEFEAAYLMRVVVGEYPMMSAPTVYPDAALSVTVERPFAYNLTLEEHGGVYTLTLENSLFSFLTESQVVGTAEELGIEEGKARVALIFEAASMSGGVPRRSVINVINKTQDSLEVIVYGDGLDYYGRRYGLGEFVEVKALRGRIAISMSGERAFRDSGFLEITASVYRLSRTGEVVNRITEFRDVQYYVM
ncbi:MAG: type II secretion system GspH family protein [Oscillospiraceae bacterium]|nr:type II secretion system GspH family protein [Oscillospiraceae bacterium]